MSSSNVTVSSGTPIMYLLGLAFVVLKLLDKIDWSWWWVTAPFWGPWVFALALGGIVLLGAAVAAVVGKK